MGGRRPSARLRAERNALKRREERAREGGPASRSRDRGRAEAAGGRAEGAGADEEGAARHRRAWDPERATFPAKCQLRRRLPGAHPLGAGKGSANLRFLGKKIGFPPRSLSPVTIPH